MLIVSLLFTFMVLSIVSVLPGRVSAYGSSFDGGELQGIQDICSCSGGMTINTKSYVDSTTHVYLYQLGISQLFPNYNIYSSSGYFLTTLGSFSMCLVYRGEECDDSSQSPEGVFMMIGTSFNNGKNEVLSLLKSANFTPGVTAITNSIPKGGLFNQPKI